MTRILLRYPKTLKEIHAQHHESVLQLVNVDKYVITDSPENLGTVFRNLTVSIVVAD